MVSGPTACRQPGLFIWEMGMKKIALPLLVLLLAVLTIGADLNLRQQTLTSNYVTGTYANSQVDTLTWIRRGVETGATFWVHARDSVDIASVIVRRQFNGALITAIAGDTILTDQIDTTSATANKLFQATLALTPYCDTVKIFVTFQDSCNGVTSPTLKYGIGKAF